MLARLKKRADFLRIQKDGSRWTAKSLSVQFCPGIPGQIRIGFTVSKYAHKSSVKRNRIKRRLREAAREILGREAKDGFDYVLTGRTEALARPYESIKQDIVWCLGKMGH